MREGGRLNGFLNAEKIHLEYADSELEVTTRLDVPLEALPERLAEIVQAQDRLKGQEASGGVITLKYVF